MTTTAAKAASNGKPAHAEEGLRSSGLARVQESECHHLTAVASSALREAERLTDRAHELACSRYLGYDDNPGPLDWAEAGTVLSEATACAVVAVTSLMDAHELAGTASDRLPALGG